MSEEVRKDVPVFPITVLFSEGEAETYDDEEALCLDLEWFDPDDPRPGFAAKVTDANGREVELEIEKCEIVRFSIRS